MNHPLANQIAVVTGAGRGIGRAIALELAHQGARIICVSKNPENCKAVADEILSAGLKAQSIAVDVADSAAVAAACESILKEHGAVDILVNNAGITRDNLLMRMKQEEWDSVLATNLSSCFYWTKGLISAMMKKRAGRIISMTSVSGLVGNPGQVNYAAAKAGVIGFTKTMAKEVASRGILVNAVAPGFISTDMTAALGKKIHEAVVASIPLGYMGEPADIARMVAFLAGPGGKYITGQIFSVDGGIAI